MCPAAGLEPLRVGPEDPTSAEAGELVKDVGVGRHAKDLIKAVAKQMPRELRTALARFEHVQRSKYLRTDEVNRALADYLEQAPEAEKVEIAEVLSARVRANKTNAMRNSYVIVLFETEEGRTARVALHYPDYFTGSIADFDAALAAGEIDLADEGKIDVRTLRAQNDQLQAEVKRMAEETGAGGIDSETVTEIVQKAVQEALEQERAAQAEAAAENAEEEPAAEDTGDQGGDAPAEEPAADAPADDKLTEVPEGYNAKDIIEHIAEFSDDLLATLAKDDRKTVAAAAKAEQGTRKG